MKDGERYLRFVREEMSRIRETLETNIDNVTSDLKKFDREMYTHAEAYGYMKGSVEIANKRLESLENSIEKFLLKEEEED